MIPDDVQRAIAEGIGLFNAGEYFLAHEVLEDAWRPASGEIKTFLKGLIHAAVALYQYQRRNAHGARTKYRSCREYLSPSLPVFAGVDVAALLEDMAAFFSTLVDEEAPRWRPADAPTPKIRGAADDLMI